jgi:drug/metabolite transporter (DMT)-like permease
MSQIPADIRRDSLLGLLAILLWSTTIAFSRSLTEALGTFTAAALIYLLAGAAGLLVTGLQPGGWSSLSGLPRRYLLGCGALFVVYIAALYLAVGFSADRAQVLAVGLINYLWPGLSLVFSLPILKQRARPWLAVGLLLALAGVWLAMTSGSDLSPAGLLKEPLLPYLLAFFAAVCWGLYSNLSRLWAAGHDGGGVPLFLLASGLLLGLLRLAIPETSAWSTGMLLRLFYMAIFPGMLAYVLWDQAVRKGEIILVASLSYLTPLLSTLISAVVLNVRPGLSLWVGAGLVICGAVIGKRAILTSVPSPSPALPPAEEQ